MTPELNKVKMVFLDIDGTLYNTKKQVTEYTKNILNKAKDEKNILFYALEGAIHLYVKYLKI